MIPDEELRTCLADVTGDATFDDIQKGMCSAMKNCHSP